LFHEIKFLGVVFIRLAMLMAVAVGVFEPRRSLDGHDIIMAYKAEANAESGRCGFRSCH